MRALAVALLAACATDYAEPVYRCQLIRSCGEHGDLTTVEWAGEAAEVQEAADEWTRACHELTASDVPERCDFVLCGVVCRINR